YGPGRGLCGRDSESVKRQHERQGPGGGTGGHICYDARCRRLAPRRRRPPAVPLHCRVDEVTTPSPRFGTVMPRQGAAAMLIRLRSSRSLSSLLIAAVFAALASAYGDAPPTLRPGALGGGVTLLPNGWKIAPAGRHVQVGSLPLAVVESPDGK